MPKKTQNLSMEVQFKTHLSRFCLTAHEELRYTLMAGDLKFMQRRSFLLGSLSTTTILLTGKRSQAGVTETWRSYNTARFAQVRDYLSQNNYRWIDVDLRRMRVTALQGNRIIAYPDKQLLFLCDDGDVYNPTITGLFSPDGTAELVPMSGKRQLELGYKEYTNVLTHYVIFFAGGYALHGLDPSYRTSGSHVSAGCIRLNYEDARLLYESHRANPLSAIAVGYSDSDRSLPWYGVG